MLYNLNIMKLVFATNNNNKLAEVKKLVPENIQLLNLNDIDCNEEIPETTGTIEGNAKQKAEFVFKKYHVRCFADDTGLEVEALNNEPGVNSAMYAGEQKNAGDNMEKLLKELDGITNRSARFKTVISFCTGSETLLFEGIINGKIINEKKGKNGFGYDPLFIPDGYDKTFAELPLSVKNKISHRAIAVGKLMQYLHNYREK